MMLETVKMVVLEHQLRDTVLTEFEKSYARPLKLFFLRTDHARGRDRRVLQLATVHA
jgi:hypothetical protein